MAPWLGIFSLRLLEKCEKLPALEMGNIGDGFGSDTDFLSVGGTMGR